MLAERPIACISDVRSGLLDNKDRGGQPKRNSSLSFYSH